MKPIPPPDDLRDLLLRGAGPTVFDRGSEYFRAGKVVGLEFAPGQATARVTGTREYRVRLRITDVDEDCDCSCPYALGVGLCKHVVAVGLAWLDACGQPLGSTAWSGGAEPLAGPAAHDLFLGKAEALRTWANGKGVAGLLRAPVSGVADQVNLDLPPAARWSLSGLTVERALTADPCLPHLRLEAAQRARLRAGTWKFLTTGAEHLARGLEQQRLRADNPPQPPVEPALRALFDRATAGRPPARPGLVARPKEVAVGRLELVQEPLAVRYHERSTATPLDFLGPRVAEDAEADALVTFGVPLAGQAPLRGRCARDGSDDCVHVVAGLELLVDTLSAQSRSSLKTGLAEELARPTWDRALAVIDSFTPAAARAQAARAEVLSWRLARQPGGFGLVPYRHAALKRGGISRGTQARLDDLVEGKIAVATAQDTRTAELLVFAQRSGYLTESAAAGLKWRALASLEGHPNLQLGDANCEPVTLRREVVKLVAQEAGEGEVCLTACLGGRPLRHDELAIVLELDQRSAGKIAWLDEAGGACLLAEIAGEVRPFLQAIHRFGGSFPRGSHEPLLSRLARLEGKIEVVLPASLRGEQVQPDPSPVLRLAALPEGGLAVRARVRPLPKGLPFPPGEGPVELASSHGGRRSFCRREFALERARATELFSSLGLVLTGDEARVDEPQRALDLVVSIEARSRQGLTVEWEQEPIRLSRPMGLSDLKLRVESGVDCFGLHGTVSADGENLGLADLLEAIRHGRRYVRLNERTWAVLDQQLRERLTSLAELVYDGRGGLEVSPAAAPALDDLAAELGSFKADASWRALCKRLQSAKRSNPRVPSGLRAELRDYQKEGFRWMARLSSWGVGACLADDMGLGKTVQALALLLQRAKQGPALVVAPASVCFNWLAEAARFAPSLRFCSYFEADRQSALASLGKGDVLVMSYSLMARDADKLAAVRFATVVLDEAQAVKNADTHRARAARRLQADFRLSLTGTPLENHLGELWSQFRILFPGLLGSREQFRERFALPIECDHDRGRREALSKVLRPFLLRRAKAEVAPELPPRTEITVRVSLSTAERECYEAVRRAVLEELARAPAERQEQRRFQVLAALTRLRQLACHVGLVDGTWAQGSSKLDRLGELVAELKDEGHRALVFSQFTRHLRLAQAGLEARGIRCLYLDGATPQDERGELVRRFQAGEGEAFLISLKAGGTGINLTGADNVVHLDPWWNPAVEDQATDRAHRIGQTRPVTVYRLISTATVEEAIVALHAQKRALVEQVLAGAGAAAKLSADDLMELIRAGGEIAREGGSVEAAVG